MKLKFSTVFIKLCLGGFMCLHATTKNYDIPIKKVALYSSGVGFFEHSGVVADKAKIKLSFQKEALNDILKSLTIHDSNTQFPHVSYSSEETIEKTLKSLSINLLESPSIVEILNSLCGAEIKIYAPNEIVGKIINAQTIKIIKDEQVFENSTLSLFIDGKIQIFKISEIVSYSFVDKKISSDLNRALELILNSKNDDIRNIDIFLPGNKKRGVRLSYVMANPIWKTTYRFDLSDKKPLLQGWAIIDNTGDIDWENVQLSLVAGSPVSFIQNLYAPYYVERPTIPLSIATFAKAKTFDSGYELEAEQNYDMLEEYNTIQSSADIPRQNRIMSKDAIKSKYSAGVGIKENYQVTSAKNAGELFVFTATNPVTVKRQQSAMIPLVQTSFDAEKVSIFSGIEANVGNEINPSLGVRFKNNSGIKLPAGPISVYDAGAYAGDALLEFLPENEKRIISYGDDLSVRGFLSSSTENSIDSVSISKGVLKIKRNYIYSKTYTFKNSASFAKKLILEHPFIANAKLIHPKNYNEKTTNLYRFDINLPASQETKISVKEELPSFESISISNMQKNSILSYSSNKEFPKKIQDALKKVANLQADVDSITSELTNTQNLLTSKLNEQDRLRKNIDAVKSDSATGKEYVKKLTLLDKEIETINKKIEDTLIKLQKAQKAYSDFIYILDI